MANNMIYIDPDPYKWYHQLAMVLASASKNIMQMISIPAAGFKFRPPFIQ
jgi:hypothetical protein